MTTAAKLERDVPELPVGRGWHKLTGGLAAHFSKLLLVPLVVAGAVTGVGFTLSEFISARSISMLYLACVVASALVGGRGGAIVGALMSFLAYDFFFIEPRLTFTVGHPDEVVTLVIFFGVAAVTGALAARVNEEAARAERKAIQAQDLLHFSAALSAAYGIDAVLATTATLIGRALSAPTVVLVVADDELTVAATSGAAEPVPNIDLEAAQLAADMRQRTGATTTVMPESRWMFLPIVAGRRLMAVLGVRVQEVDSEKSDVLISMVEQTAIAIDRARRVRESAETNLLRESERLQSALLSSLSHDFRTPLASITGAASSVRQLGESMDAAMRDDLLKSIEEDAGRLNRFLANLFDMTRIESGRLAVRREVLSIPEIVERAIARIHAIDPGMDVDTSFAPELGDVLGDAILLEQVLFNLLDNARKYASSSKPVMAFARPEREWTELSVTDYGEGIPATDLDRIFEKFYRRGGPDGRVPGTGLGLPIARGFILAMGGTIRAESPASRKRGTRFIIRLKSAESTRR